MSLKNEKKNSDFKRKTKQTNKNKKNAKKQVDYKKKKIIIISIILGFVLIIISTLLGLTLFNKNWKAASNKYKEAYEIVSNKNNELTELIEKSEKLVTSKDRALDEELRPLLETAISDAKAVKQKLPFKPFFTKNINKETEKLNKIDYDKEFLNLQNKYSALDISIKKYKLVDKPTEAYVIKCLKTITEIKNISAVTEDNDPNGNLNKPGGYTATVYFSDSRIKLDKEIYGYTVIEQGTDGGGAIEVYATVEDAEKRRDYLATYDGTIFANGTHTVIGTVLVRTSNEYTASQQKDMEAKIIEALTKIETSEPKEDTKKEESTPVEENKPAEKQEEKKQETTQPLYQKPTFEGGICKNIDAWGDGMCIDKTTKYKDGESMFVAGRLVGITGTDYIIIKWDFPNGEKIEQEWDLQNGKSFEIGFAEVGIGKGTVTIIYKKTGEIMATFPFEFYS